MLLIPGNWQGCVETHLFERNLGIMPYWLLIMRGILTIIFPSQYLEKRFSNGVRIIGSVCFIIQTVRYQLFIYLVHTFGFSFYYVLILCYLYHYYLVSSQSPKLCELIRYIMNKIRITLRVISDFFLLFIVSVHGHCDLWSSHSIRSR